MYQIDSRNVKRVMSYKNKPVLRAKPGQQIEMITRNCFGDQPLKKGDGPLQYDPDIAGNPATGPIFVEGAKVGDVLKIHILKIQPISNAVMGMGTDMGVFADESETECTRIFSIKEDETHFYHYRIKNKPMLGVIGVAPPPPFEIDTVTPGDHGGNMDCNRIVAGSTVYLPVFVEGGLLAIGDVHSVMGDGEVSSGGAEVAAKVKIQIDILQDEDINCPIVVSEGDVMLLASRETIDEAARQAVKKTKDFLMKKLRIPHHEACMLLSLKGNVRICQMVDPLMTCRMEVPLEVFRAYGYEWE